MSVPRYLSRISSSILSGPGSGSIPFSLAPTMAGLMMCRSRPIEFFGDAAEGRLWVVVAHVVEGAERRQSYADAILTPNIAHRLDHINEQPHPILDWTAISVGAPIGARINQLVEQITVGGEDLHTVESGLQRISRSVRILLDNVGHLLDLQGPGRDERNQFPFAVFILDERLPARLDGRGRDRERAVGLQRWIAAVSRGFVAGDLDSNQE